MPLHTYAGKVGDQVPALFAAFDGIVAIVSLGAAVRLIALHLKNKGKPTRLSSSSMKLAAVIPGTFSATSVAPTAGRLSRHRARRPGRADHGLGCPRNTRRRPARPRTQLDLRASHDEIVRCSAAMVNDEAVALVQTGSTDWWARHANGRSGTGLTGARAARRRAARPFCRCAVDQPAGYAGGKSPANWLGGVVYRP